MPPNTADLDDQFEVHASGGVLLRPAVKKNAKKKNGKKPDSKAGSKKAGSKKGSSKRTAKTTEVLVVHRPRYDDWSLPKGKRDPGETDEECALREVLEETGYRCELGDEVSRVTYDDNRGRSKLVRYWFMTIVDGEFRANDEVDEAAWVTLEEASEMLSYDRDRVVLSAVKKRL